MAIPCPYHQGMARRNLTLHIMVSREERDAFAAAAAADNRTVSDYLRVLVKADIQRKGLNVPGMSQPRTADSK